MLTAILLGLVAMFANAEYLLGTSLLSRPIITGVLTGLVLGDLQSGLVLGATLELAFIGAFSIRSSNTTRNYFRRNTRYCICYYNWTRSRSCISIRSSNSSISTSNKKCLYDIYTTTICT